MDALNPTLSEYADRALPRIFSETEAFLEIVERKLAAGKYLHAEDIAKLQKTYREEWGDADLL
ncbi:MAG: hypothetical protein QG650_309 [Patescibacteria group bacterium]|nr:hypothetical protein [Patescibacteria group bacterium]